jgi:hypothetical protein
MLVHLRKRTSTILQVVRHLALGTAVPISSQQCRAIHLYYSAKTNEHASNHRIKGYSPYDNYASSKDVQLELWSKKGMVQIKRTNLHSVLKDDIKPGTLLVPLVDLATKKVRDGQYVLQELDLKRDPIAGKKNKTSKVGGRGSKEIHFKLSSPPEHFAHLMWKTWHMLTAKQIVEFHIHLQKPLLQSQGDAEFDEALNHPNAIHLRPDVILRTLHRVPRDQTEESENPLDNDTKEPRARPENAQNIIHPWADRKSQVCWVTTVTRKGGHYATDKALAANQKKQFEMEAMGVGIPLKEERKRLKEERKAQPGYRSHTQARTDAFTEIRSIHPSMEPIVRRAAKKREVPGKQILSLGRSLKRQFDILSSIAQEEPEVFKIASKGVTPNDSPDKVRRKIAQARITIRKQESAKGLQEQEVLAALKRNGVDGLPVKIRYLLGQADAKDKVPAALEGWSGEPSSVPLRNQESKKGLNEQEFLAALRNTGVPDGHSVKIRRPIDRSDLRGKELPIALEGWSDEPRSLPVRFSPTDGSKGFTTEVSKPKRR